MPTYDYGCDDCGYQFEKFQSIKARKLSRCPRCGGRLRRLIGTGAGVIFKGSGFYQTDYRSQSYREGEKKDKEAVKPPEKKSTPEKKKTAAPTSAAAEK